jgi:hypothetical protein
MPQGNMIFLKNTHWIIIILKMLLDHATWHNKFFPIKLQLKSLSHIILFYFPIL